MVIPTIKLSNFCQLSSAKGDVACVLRLEEVIIWDAWFSTFWTRFRWSSLQPPQAVIQYICGKTNASTMSFFTAVGSCLANLESPARVACELRITVET